MCEHAPSMSFPPFGLWCYQIKTRMEISNGWINPQSLFPTMLPARPETQQVSGTVDRSSQETMTANGKRQTASRAWVTSVRWRADRIRNQLRLPVSRTNKLFLTYCLVKGLSITFELVCFRFPLWSWTLVVRGLLLSFRDWEREELAGCWGPLQQRAGSPGQLPLTGRTELPDWWDRQRENMVHSSRDHREERKSEEAKYCSFKWTGCSCSFLLLQLTCQRRPGWVWMTSMLKTSLCTPMELLQWVINTEVTFAVLKNESLIHFVTQCKSV